MGGVGGVGGAVAEAVAAALGRQKGIREEDFFGGAPSSTETTTCICSLYPRKPSFERLCLLNY